MKKKLLLFSSIILFLLSLFFIVGILVFISNSDIDGIVIFGIPFILFGLLFYVAFKKYLKTINFNINNTLEKWKNSRFLRIMDLVLSCLSYIFVLASINSQTDLFILSLILTLFFGILYIIKPLLNSKLDFSIIKNNWGVIMLHAVLLIITTILSSHYWELRINWGISSFDLSLLDSYNSGIEKIVFLILYGTFKLALRQGLIILFATAIYVSLILYVNYCFKHDDQNEKKFLTFDILELCLFIMIGLIHYSIIFKSFVLILLNAFIIIILIAKIIIYNHAKITA